MKIMAGIFQRLISFVIFFLLIVLVAEVLFVIRHGYLFRLDDILSFIRLR